MVTELHFRQNFKFYPTISDYLQWMWSYVLLVSAQIAMDCQNKDKFGHNVHIYVFTVYYLLFIVFLAGNGITGDRQNLRGWDASCQICLIFKQLTTNPFPVLEHI